MKKKLFLIAILLLALIMLLQIFGDKTPEKITPSGKKIRVGMIGPLSGPLSAQGKNGLEGLKAALKIQPLLNNGDAIEFVVEDDLGEPTRTIAALRKLTETEKVAVVLVFSDSASVLALEPFVDRFRTPVIAVLATHPDISKHSKYVIQLCFDDVFQGSVAALFVRDELLVKKAAILNNPKNPYSTRLATEFRQKFEATGGQVTETVQISDAVDDLSAIMEGLRARKTQLLYMPVQAQCVSKVVKATREIGWYPKMMGSDGLLATIISKYHDDLELMEGLMATDFFSSIRDLTPYQKRLKKAYTSLFNHQPTTFFVLGAEAYAILQDTMNRCSEPDDRQEINDKLRQTSNFTTISGKISITAKGKTKRSLFIEVLAKPYSRS